MFGRGGRKGMLVGGVNVSMGRLTRGVSKMVLMSNIEGSLAPSLANSNMY